MEFEKLQMIIAEVLGKDSEQIYAKARLVEDLGVDSLEVFQIIMGMEDTFDVILEEEDRSLFSFKMEMARWHKKSYNVGRKLLERPSWVKIRL